MRAHSLGLQLKAKPLDTTFMELFTNGSFKAMRASIACDLIHAPCVFRLLEIENSARTLIYRVICLTPVPTSTDRVKFSYIPMDNCKAIWLKDDDEPTDMILFIPKDIKFKECKSTGSDEQTVQEITLAMTQGKAHIIEAANDVCKKFKEEAPETEVVQLIEDSVLHRIIPLSFSESRAVVTNYINTDELTQIHSYLETCFLETWLATTMVHNISFNSNRELKAKFVKCAWLASQNLRHIRTQTSKEGEEEYLPVMKLESFSFEYFTGKHLSDLFEGYELANCIIKNWYEWCRFLSNLDNVCYQNADNLHESADKLATTKRGLKINKETEWLLISINPNDGHWSLCIVHLKQDKLNGQVQVYHLDSLAHSSDKVSKAVIKTLNIVDKSRSDNATFYNDEDLMITRVRCTRQKHNLDCALFVCKYMEAFIQRISGKCKISDVKEMMKGIASDVSVDNLSEFRWEMGIWLLKTSALVNSEKRIVNSE